VSAAPGLFASASAVRLPRTHARVSSHTSAPLRSVVRSVSTTTFDEGALTPNPSNMKEYNPAAPNGSYDLTKPESKGNSSSVECARARPPANPMSAQGFVPLSRCLTAARLCAASRLQVSRP
jgi:hypothetical protein